MAKALDYITIKGFRSLRSIEKLRLGPINVLVGPNGSGKSNFIGVFEFLHALREGQLEQYTEKRGGADRIVVFGSKETPELELSFGDGETENVYRTTLSTTEDDRFYIVENEASWHWPGDVNSEHDGSKQWIPRRLDSWRIYHFHDTSDSAPMKKTADVDDNRFFRGNGANLAAYLFFLYEKEPEAYQLIRKTIQRVTPFFDDFQLAPLRLNPDKIKLEWRHKSSDSYMDASALSDGTLRFMCLATLFLQPAEYRPSVILIDEPELGLHPYAITLLASLIKSASRETQVIASTQSPLLLDHFVPEDVLVAELDDGATSLRRLDSDELKDWLDEYSLGELWQKNQFGGRPTRG